MRFGQAEKAGVKLEFAALGLLNKFAESLTTPGSRSVSVRKAEVSRRRVAGMRMRIGPRWKLGLAFFQQSTNGISVCGIANHFAQDRLEFRFACTGIWRFQDMMAHSTASKPPDAHSRAGFRTLSSLVRQPMSSPKDEGDISEPDHLNEAAGVDLVPGAGHSNEVAKGVQDYKLVTVAGT